MRLIIFFLAIAILLESTLVSLPLTLLILVFASIVIRKNDIFPLAFLSGLFLDILRLGTVGMSSAYFVAMVMIVFLYQKKFEITSLNFIGVTSAVGTLGYLLATGTSYLFFQVLISTLIILASFRIARMREWAWKK